MRILSLLLLTCIFLAAACSKSSEKSMKKSGEVTLQGKWVFIQEYYSDGARMHYVDANPANQYITLYQDEKLNGNMTLFENYTSYKVEQQNRIRFFSVGGTNNRLFHYYIDTSAQKLFLSPLDPMCIEGCGYIFQFK